MEQRPGAAAGGEIPNAAARLFPADRLDQAAAYAELLATDGVIRGLIGPREAPRIWDRHVLNCALMAASVPEGATLADIGAGAGLPGLVLAIARPDLQVTLIEPLLRRTSFLEDAIAHLGLDNVVVLRGKAELFHGKHRFQVVTARAVAGLDRLIPWCMPLVDKGGQMVVMKGSSAADEITAVTESVAGWGCTVPELFEIDDPDAGVVRLVRVSWSGEPQVSLAGVGEPVQKRALKQRKQKHRRPSSDDQRSRR